MSAELRACQCGRWWLTAEHAERAGHTPLDAISSVALELANEAEAALRAASAATCWHERTERHGGPEPWAECGGHGDCVNSGPCDCPCLTCLDCGSHLYLRNPPGHGHDRHWRHPDE
jgi:hypothetical protein